MANTLGNFNVPLYAAEALLFLKNSLRTPRLVNRSYERERAAFNKGDVINLRRPGSFTVADAPIAAGSVADVVPDSVQIALNQHKEVKLKITDRELAYSTEAFITEHVGPMAYALGNYIDQQLLDLALEIPHKQEITSSSATAAVLSTAGRIMTENRAPEDARRNYAFSPATWATLTSSTAFSQFQGAGMAGVATQQTGQLETKYGFNPYQTNNLTQVPAVSGLTITTPTAISNGAYSKGATSLTLAAGTLTGTIPRGAILKIGSAASGSIAERAQLYAVTADATASGNSVTVSISPPLRSNIVGSTAWSRITVASDAAYQAELAFHSNALALVTVPLPSEAMGARVQTVTDEGSGLSLRARLFYDGNASTHYFAMDVLMGRKVLDADLAVRGAAV